MAKHAQKGYFFLSSGYTRTHTHTHTHTHTQTHTYTHTNIHTKDVYCSFIEKHLCPFPMLLDNNGNIAFDQTLFPYVSPLITHNFNLKKRESGDCISMHKNNQQTHTLFKDYRNYHNFYSFTFNSVAKAKLFILISCSLFTTILSDF